MYIVILKTIVNYKLWLDSRSDFWAYKDVDMASTHINADWIIDRSKTLRIPQAIEPIVIPIPGRKKGPLATPKVNIPSKRNNPELSKMSPVFQTGKDHWPHRPQCYSYSVTTAAAESWKVLKATWVSGHWEKWCKPSGSRSLSCPLCSTNLA